MLYTGTLLQPLLQLAASNPDFIVLNRRNKVLTGKQLLQKSTGVAAALRERGFKENDIAVVAAIPGEELIEIIYAVIMLRGKIAIIDPEMGKENYASKMKQLLPQWMFIDSRLLLLQEHPFLKWALSKILKKLPEIKLIDGICLVAVGQWMPVVRKHISFSRLQNYNGIAPSFTNEETFSENIITYTSGTLSTPKGVLHSASSLGASISALTKLVQQTPHAVLGTYLPHFMMLGITAGLPVTLMKADLSGKRKIAFIKKESIGILFGPPSDYMPMILYCEKNGQTLPHSLQHVLIGSAPVHTRFLQRLIAVLPEHTRISCTYGMTENLLVAVIDGRKKAQYDGDGDIVGKPIDAVLIRFSPEGEIMVKSPQLFSRYFHETCGTEWHYTGDLGKTDEHGNIILTGRKKEMIIRRNMNIYPALYENTIKHIKGVEEAAMVGIYSTATHDEKVYLALEGNGINMLSVKKQLSKGKYSIDAEAFPDHIFQMKIPRKGRQHKIDRAAIIEYIKTNGL